MLKLFRGRSLDRGYVTDTETNTFSKYDRQKM